ncbi:flagellar basal-body MS-ring/collar protein FliF [Buchnera aphidicola (Mindarus keteleerifoliae)]|uniref:flagellar basal-body MS-ring/collar protein FliF n=1 Tax=Buchnera aphidicola TaxID=9 RepID=UPI0031B69D58
MKINHIQDMYQKIRQKINFITKNLINDYRILFFIAFLILSGMIIFFLWNNSSKYSVIYSNLSNEEKQVFINKLEDSKIPYRFSKDSNSLLVPTEKLENTKNFLFKNSSSEKKEVGFELLDNQKFGISQFNERINYERALEGELSKTIQKLILVNNARVHIAWPKSSLFMEEKKEPSASVFLELKPNFSLNLEQINAIKNLVSNSITGLSVKKVMILDQFGRLLDDSNAQLSFFDDFKNKYISNIESKYKKKIKSLLIPIFGSKNIQVEVTAQIDFNEKERTNESYSPNLEKGHQSIRSEENSIDEKVISKYLEALKELILSTRKLSLHNSEKDVFSRKELEKNVIFQKKNNIDFLNFLNVRDFNNKIINYELNRSISHIRVSTGKIKKLSIGVVINYLKNGLNKKKSISDSDLNKIKKLISGAVGYSLKRGDQINIVSALFSNNDLKESKITVHPLNGFNFFLEYKSIGYIFLFLLCLILLNLCFLIRKRS